MPNQWKPTPPLPEIEPLIRKFWAARLTDKQIVAELRKCIDTERYGIGRTKFNEIRKQLGLQRTRKQGHTVESIRLAMQELRETYPQAGAREVVSILWHEQGMGVPRRVVQEYFHTFEPDLVQQRKANRLRRRQFWAAGVNDIWAVDQHDKWLRYGLALHTGIEPFSGRILWMKIWHSNRHSQLVLSYYLETVEHHGFMPLVTQSDPGTENFGIANAQTMLRQLHDQSLVGYVQHRWMRVKKNIMPEIAWSQLRRRFSPGFEAILQQGVDNGWYDPDNTLQLLLFRWLFIPWLQAELDRYKYRVNNSLKRRDRNKIIPHGVPELIFSSPSNYGALDFKVDVQCASIEEVRALYINESHPVFDLVPPPINELFRRSYYTLGSPPIERGSAWNIYLDVLAMVREYPEIPEALHTIISADNSIDELELMAGQQDLPENDDNYMGGVGNGTEHEHHRILDELDVQCEQVDEEDNDAGTADNADTIDMPPLIVAAFSDDESDKDISIDI